MAELVLKLGGDAFYQYIEAFGLKEKTGIDVPGEALGLTLAKDNARIRDYGAMAIGQTNAFTPVQMVTAISAVANGGYLMTPYVVDRVIAHFVRTAAIKVFIWRSHGIIQKHGRRQNLESRAWFIHARNSKIVPYAAFYRRIIIGVKIRHIGHC